MTRSSRQSGDIVMHVYRHTDIDTDRHTDIDTDTQTDTQT